MGFVIHLSRRVTAGVTLAFNAARCQAGRVGVGGKADTEPMERLGGAAKGQVSGEVATSRNTRSSKLAPAGGSGKESIERGPGGRACGQSQPTLAAQPRHAPALPSQRMRGRSDDGKAVCQQALEVPAGGHDLRSPAQRQIDVFLGEALIQFASKDYRDALTE